MSRFRGEDFHWVRAPAGALQEGASSLVYLAQGTGFWEVAPWTRALSLTFRGWMRNWLQRKGFGEAQRAGRGLLGSRAQQTLTAKNLDFVNPRHWRRRAAGWLATAQPRLPDPGTFDIMATTRQSVASLSRVVNHISGRSSRSSTMHPSLSSIGKSCPGSTPPFWIPSTGNPSEHIVLWGFPRFHHHQSMNLAE
jgi:hypothetical protein